MTTQEQINAKEASVIAQQDYLRKTDYQSIRAFEGGAAMSDEVRNARAAARAVINTLQEEIEMLRAQLIEEQNAEDQLL